MTPMLPARLRITTIVSLFLSSSVQATWSWIGEKVGPIGWSASTVSPSGVVLMGSPGWVLTTKDGDQFALSNIPLDFKVHAIHSTGTDDVVVAAGENGGIGLSEDGGKTWRQVRARIRNAGHLHAVVWRDSVRRWMVLGDSGLTMESTDGRVWSPGPRIDDRRSVRRALTYNGEVWIVHDRWVVDRPAVRWLASRGRNWEVRFPEEFNPIDLLLRSNGLVLFVGQDSARHSLIQGDQWRFSFDYYRGLSNRGWRFEGTKSFTAAFPLDGSLQVWFDGGLIGDRTTRQSDLGPDEDSLLTFNEGADFLVAAGSFGRLHRSFITGNIALWDRLDAPPSARTFRQERHGELVIASGGRGLASVADPPDLARSSNDAFPAQVVLATWTGRKWVAPIDSGLVLVSRDATLWNRAETGTRLQFRDAAYGLGKSVVALDDGRLLISEDDSSFGTSRSTPRAERFQAFTFTGSQFAGSYLDGTWCTSQNLADWKCVGPNPSVVPQRMARAGNFLVGRSRTFELLISRNDGLLWTKEGVPGPPIREIAVDGDSLWVLHDDRTTKFRRLNDTVWRAGPTIPWHISTQISTFLVRDGRILVDLSLAKPLTRRSALLEWQPSIPSRATRPSRTDFEGPRWSHTRGRLQIILSEPTTDWTLELRGPDGRFLSKHRPARSVPSRRLNIEAPRKVFIATIRTPQGLWSRLFAAP